VPEHELLDLGGCQVPAVTLALDQLGRPDHALSATKTTDARRTRSGPASGGSCRPP
jgi:hypothetical protein